MIATPVSIVFRGHGNKGAIEQQLDIAGERRPNAEHGHSDGVLVRSAAGNRLKRTPMSILPSISCPVNSFFQVPGGNSKLLSSQVPAPIASRGATVITSSPLRNATRYPALGPVAHSALYDPSAPKHFGYAVLARKACRMVQSLGNPSLIRAMICSGVS